MILVTRSCGLSALTRGRTSGRRRRYVADLCRRDGREPPAGRLRSHKPLRGSISDGPVRWKDSICSSGMVARMLFLRISDAMMPMCRPRFGDARTVSVKRDLRVQAFVHPPRDFIELNVDAAIHPEAVAVVP